jgi:hypothetical protein
MAALLLYSPILKTMNQSKFLFIGCPFSATMDLSLLNMRDQSWEPEALLHVQVMAKYLSAQAISSEVLAQDPTQRDRMAKELSQSKDPNVRHELVADPNEDPMAMLRDWDKALSQEATTFEESV